MSVALATKRITEEEVQRVKLSQYRTSMAA